MTQLVSVLEIYYKIYVENPMTHVTADYKTKKKKNQDTAETLLHFFAFFSVANGIACFGPLNIKLAKEILNSAFV